MPISSTRRGKVRAGLPEIAVEPDVVVLRDLDVSGLANTIAVADVVRLAVFAGTTVSHVLGAFLPCHLQTGWGGSR